MKKLPFEYRLTFIYIIIGALWILFSDKLVVGFTKDAERIRMISTYKGWFYVLVTGIILFYLIKKEIHRRKLLYQELLETKKEIVNSERLKTAFLSNLSHYIRSPMNSILGFVELLQNRETSPENQQMFITYINERSQHLLHTLNSIVEISKIQEGLSEVRNEWFSTLELMRSLEVTANLDLTAKNKPLSLILKIENGEHDKDIYSDRMKIFNILLNLVSNAINFTDHGEIEIVYLSNKNAHIFKVKDAGKGISSDKQQSLFTKFMYTSSDIHTSGESAGLGLYLSAKWAKLLEGELWLEETNTKGSTFALRVPKLSPNT